MKSVNFVIYTSIVFGILIKTSKANNELKSHYQGQSNSNHSQNELCGLKEDCKKNNHHEGFKCQLGFRFVHNQCEENPNQIDGKFEVQKCKSFFFYNCSNVLLTFLPENGLKITTFDTEISSKYKNDSVSRFRIELDGNCVNCRNKNVIYLPIRIAETFPNLSEYFANRLDVKILKYENFKNMKNLKKLTIDNNEIETIDENSFDDLNELVFLDLSQNKIKNFDPRIFKSTLKLTYLNLSLNQIISLIADHLKFLSKLKFLDLSYNKITNLNSNVFENSKNLENLRLNSNQIKNLPLGIFDKTENLKEIILSSNELTTLNSDIFNNLINLKFISLSYNKFTTLDENLFKNNKNLESIILHGNDFSYLPWKLFEDKTNLTNFYIKLNKFNEKLYVGSKILTEDERNEIKNDLKKYLGNGLK
ncbi:hypothetical protein PVAND_016500 [Polypedilum vanderplanki]|uniref:L domain-like protein n=1 Tax=Polypedilum vanderplanki TaxID=319348 RepID=A0A9J6BGD3_POLVA|nr:hypothetical protein PVAND_016500 [Polypedilum vanderplanki]